MPLLHNPALIQVSLDDALNGITESEFYGDDITEFDNSTDFEEDYGDEENIKEHYLDDRYPWDPERECRVDVEEELVGKKKKSRNYDGSDSDDDDYDDEESADIDWCSYEKCRYNCYRHFYITNKTHECTKCGVMSCKQCAKGSFKKCSGDGCNNALCGGCDYCDCCEEEKKKSKRGKKRKNSSH